MTATFASLCSIDDRLARADVPPLTAWWRRSLDDWYAGGQLRLVASVGRGGAKSHTLAKAALNEAIFGDHVIPAGERHYAVLVAENVSEAAGRLRLIEAALTALRIRFTRNGDTIDLVDAPRGFRVLACRVGAVSGHRAFFLGLDELAKWNIEGSNPASEIVASARAMTITHSRAREFFVSSPLARVGLHYELVSQGTTAAQLVVCAPSWVACAEGITEKQCREREPDERVFLREYGAEPSDSESAAFSPALIDPCFGFNHYSAEPLDRPTIVLDSSQGRGDSWTFAAAQWVRPFADEQPSHLWMRAVRGRGLVREDLVEPGDVIEHAQAMPARDEHDRLIPHPRAGWRPPPRLRVFDLTAYEGRFHGVLTADEICDRVAELAHVLKTRDVIGDQYQAFMLESAFRRRECTYRQVTFTNESKTRGVLRLRQWFREGILAIDDSNASEAQRLRGELLAFREKISPSGALTYGARQGAKDDRVALLLGLAIADTDELLRGSPIRPSYQRHEVHEFENSMSPTFRGRLT